MSETGTFKRVASLSEIPVSGGLCVEIGKRRIGLFKMGATVYAVDDTCPHALASLCDGEVEGTEIVCPLHYATFDLRTGACTGPPAAADLATYKVRVVGDDVEIEL